MYLVSEILTYFKLDIDKFMVIAQREKFVVRGEYVKATAADIDRACTAEVWKKFWQNPVAAHYKGKGIDLLLNLKIDHLRYVRTVKYILFINDVPVHEWGLDDFLRDKILILPRDKYTRPLHDYFGCTTVTNGAPRKSLYVLLTPDDVVFAETFGDGAERE